MNQEKIGKFIAKCRKEKKITQSELAEKLNVTDRSISNWETGRNMPDLSLFKPLCDELDITINDLMSGEKIKPEDYNEKLNENIINTINYSHKKISYTIKSMGIFLITIGILISITAFSIFPSESSWGSIYGIVGGIISFLGITKFTNKYSLLKKLILNISYLLFYILILFIIDFIAVLNIKQPPRFALLKESSEKMIVYRAPFYNVYRINYNSLNEYYIIDTKHKYTDETIPVSPFNREKAGINNIIKYKNKYLGNNSNTGNLINNLPLSEYGYVFKINSNDLGLEINYNITDWYIEKDNYLEKSLIYNTVSIFQLIDNVSYIQFNFSGSSYKISKETIQKNYLFYNKISENLEANFNTYLEDKMNDTSFIIENFEKLYK